MQPLDERLVLAPVWRPPIIERRTVVKRQRREEIVGVLEFEGRTAEDAEFQSWLAAHRDQNGGSVRVSKGAKGVRVMFGKQADMDLWKERADLADKAKAKAAKAG